MTNYLRKSFIYPRKSTMMQFIRYGIVGGLASILDISIFNLGIYLLHLNYIVSNTLSFTFGLTANYILSREWVFHQKVHHFKKDFLLFSLIGISGLLFSNILLFLLIDYRVLYWLLPVSNGNFIKPLAKILTVAIILFWNFFARKKIVFQNES